MSVLRCLRVSQLLRRNAAGACRLSVDSYKMKDSVLENPFYNKYKKKLEQVQGPSEVFMQHIKSENEATPIDKPQPTASYFKAPDLNSVMKIELVEDKDAEDISQIWVEYHKTKDCVCSVLPSSKYIEFRTKATHCPRFVYALPRGEGYEMWYSQFTDQRCHFTSLINYQRYQDNSPIAFTMTYFTELLQSKGIVLMQGEIDASHLSVIEAQNLANQMQLFYCSSDGSRYSLVHTFNHQPQEFDYNVLIDQLNNLTMV